MNRIFTLCSPCLLFVATHALGQTDTTKTFFDTDWKEVADSTKAEYKRIYYKHDIGFWKVIHYYKNGQVQMTGAFSDESLERRYGLFEHFYPSGQLESRATYSNGRAVGDSFTYYENGQLDVYQKFDDSGQLEEEKLYKEDGSDSFSEQPEFPGGINAMYRYLSERIRYPKSLRRKGIAGKVFLTFVVHTDGSLQDIAIIQSPDEALSREAMKVVAAMPRWKPGSRDGVLQRVKYNLPVSFQLD